MNDYLQQTTRFVPADVEARWLPRWLDSGLFHATPDPGRTPAIISRRPTSPATRTWATRSTAPFKTCSRATILLGDNACWLVGTDTPASPPNVVGFWADGLAKEDPAAKSSCVASGPGARSTAATSFASPFPAAPATTTRAVHVRRGLRPRCHTRLRGALQQGYIHGLLPRQLAPARRAAISDPRSPTARCRGRSATSATRSREAPGHHATTRPETMLGDMAKRIIRRRTLSRSCRPKGHAAAARRELPVADSASTRFAPGRSDHAGARPHRLRHRSYPRP